MAWNNWLQCLVLICEAYHNQSMTPDNNTNSNATAPEDRCVCGKRAEDGGFCKRCLALERGAE